MRRKVELAPPSRRICASRFRVQNRAQCREIPARGISALRRRPGGHAAARFRPRTEGRRCLMAVGDHAQLRQSGRGGRIPRAPDFSAGNGRGIAGDRLYSVSAAAAREGRRLLCVLFVWHGEVSAHSTPAGLLRIGRRCCGACLDPPDAFTQNPSLAPAPSNVAAPIKANMAAAIECTSFIGIVLASLSPTNTAGTSANSMPKVVPTTTSSGSG